MMLFLFMIVYARYGMYCSVDILDTLDDMATFSVITDVVYVYMWLVMLLSWMLWFIALWFLI